MTKFRILVTTQTDGSQEFLTQQWRWLPWPRWSSTYYYSDGSADYQGSDRTLEDAEGRLRHYIADTLKKRSFRSWNRTKHVLKQAKV